MAVNKRCVASGRALSRKTICGDEFATGSIKVVLSQIKKQNFKCSYCAIHRHLLFPKEIFFDFNGVMKFYLIID